MENDYILKIEGLIPKIECDKIIEGFESCSENKNPGMFGEGFVDHDVKKCVESFYHFGSEGKRGFSSINEYLPIAIKKYVDRYPNVLRVRKWNVAEQYKIQRYYPNEGFFALHCENDSADSRRILAWMIYLNDVTDDGYTEFPCQDKKFQPRVGDVLVWPAFFTHAHKGITSKTQTKYIATGWCTYLERKKLELSYV
tara:strand:- start:58 stop:648 length:591 start_codon:yes stop_codon:yes gene_type:complete